MLAHQPAINGHSFAELGEKLGVQFSLHQRRRFSLLRQRAARAGVRLGVLLFFVGLLAREPAPASQPRESGMSRCMAAATGDSPFGGDPAAAPLHHGGV